MDATIENRIRLSSYYGNFFFDFDEFESDPDAPCNLFTGNPPPMQTAADAVSLEERIARRVVELLEEGGFLRLTRKSTPPMQQPPVPRVVPTPPAKMIEDSHKSLIESLKGERLWLRSIMYHPTPNLTDRWEMIADDADDNGTVENPRISVWIWADDKRKLIEAGYGDLFNRKPISREMLPKAIPVTIKWGDWGAKIDEVLTTIQVNRRLAS